MPSITRLAALLPFLALTGALSAAPSSVAQPAAADRAIDSMAERTRPCTACHGQEGRATPEGYFPRIAGKPAGYLFNQLVGFRDGRRSNPAMAYLVQHLSDGYLTEIARYFAALDLPYARTKSGVPTPAELARGESLVRRGDAARRIPACVRCHGEAMSGVTPAIPGLLGLSREYLDGQFGAWRTGQRKAITPDCMADIAKRLGDADIRAIAGWLSSQPVPARYQPAARIAWPLPTPCGSVPRPVP